MISSTSWSGIGIAISSNGTCPQSLDYDCVNPINNQKVAFDHFILLILVLLSDSSLSSRWTQLWWWSGTCLFVSRTMWSLRSGRISGNFFLLFFSQNLSQTWGSGRCRTCSTHNKVWSVAWDLLSFSWRVIVILFLALDLIAEKGEDPSTHLFPSHLISLRKVVPCEKCCTKGELLMVDGICY